MSGKDDLQFTYSLINKQCKTGSSAQGFLHSSKDNEDIFMIFSKGYSYIKTFLPILRPLFPLVGYNVLTFFELTPYIS